MEAGEELKGYRGNRILKKQNYGKCLANKFSIIDSFSVLCTFYLANHLDMPIFLLFVAQNDGCRSYVCRFLKLLKTS